MDETKERLFGVGGGGGGDELGGEVLILLSPLNLPHPPPTPVISAATPRRDGTFTPRLSRPHPACP